MQQKIDVLHEEWIPRGRSVPFKENKTCDLQDSSEYHFDR